MAGDAPAAGDEHWRPDQRSGKVGVKSTGLKVNMGNRRKR